MKISQLGRALFGAGVMGYAVFSFVYGNFTPAIAAFPWSEVWTRGLGAILLAAGAGMFFRRTALVGRIIVGILVAGWAVSCIPPISQQPLVVGSWYGFSEAVTTLVGVVLFHSEARRGDRAARAMQALFGGACLVYGIAHFVYSTYSEPFVPTWLPGRMTLVYVTGACHAAAGIGLIIGVLPRLAANLEAIMITLFQVLVWFPSFFAHPVPKWAGSPQNQWSETLMNFVLAGAAWLVAASLQGSSWGLKRRAKAA